MLFYGNRRNTIIFLDSVNGFVFNKAKECVYCAVSPEYFNAIQAY